ncbi:HTH-type transcriptional repressor YvoA [Variibacter gotjawalensis]|uniref:HTH-type transcriptional repressor YvoA n=1 Tax=Variibacter gotjawalensis TaxID=1333996 RepID=A0A0S3Q0Y3_9BRAD|nr:GntR family transcriptional regulator [Variibacter gotjawalensis]NIK47684.1 DNA-binding GntR family transcriptional regulator [Variibacter gotjawalensis]RZS49582.1 GntR family transcriptional regulator [Variibacter gotjawalensis]BAT61844.1 HTH-type transcriptional repressor YvoA [Variibacter gotjawalensis]
MRGPAPRKLPRYREIAGELQREIRSGQFSIGSLLPIEAQLMERFGASRQTIREALRIISEQGLIVRRPGIGSIVISAEPPTLFTHSIDSASEWLRYSNETYREVVSTKEITADFHVAALLKCEPKKRWFLIEAVRRADAFAAPLGWAQFYVLPKFSRVVERRDHGRTPVHEQIARTFGQVIEHAQLEVLARGMPADIAPYLGAEPDSPSLTMIRRYFGQNDELFAVTVTTHPEGRYTYVMDMRRALKSNA